MYKCIYIYTYIDTQIHTYINAYIHTYILTYNKMSKSSPSLKIKLTAFPAINIDYHDFLFYQPF